MTQNAYDHRWNLTLPNNMGFNKIPNFFCDHYAEAGFTAMESLLFERLARYKYNSPNGCSKPSLVTIAKQLDISVSYVRKLRRSLVSKGLLQVQHLTGKPSINNFQPGAIKLQELYEKSLAVSDPITPVIDSPDPITPVIGGYHPSDRGLSPQSQGVYHPSDTKEEEVKEEEKKTQEEPIEPVPIQDPERQEQESTSARADQARECKTVPETDLEVVERLTGQGCLDFDEMMELEAAEHALAENKQDLEIGEVVSLPVQAPTLERHGIPPELRAKADALFSKRETPADRREKERLLWERDERIEFTKEVV